MWGFSFPGVAQLAIGGSSRTGHSAASAVWQVYIGSREGMTVYNFFEVIRLGGHEQPWNSPRARRQPR